MDTLISRVFSLAGKQYAAMSRNLGEGKFPRTFEGGDSLVTSDCKYWCSGFYPGSLWYIYEYTRNDSIRVLADKYTKMLDSRKYSTANHDIGFQLNCSYGNALRITGDSCYREPLLTGARSLATRFNPIVGCIRSWDFVRKGCDWKFPVIIDNMMNLELLNVASDLMKDPGLMQIAESHANTTMKNHFRKDYTTYHLVDYDPENGAVRSRQTVQGYSNGSAWARGQAWGLYGFSMMFRQTHDAEYLRQAENIARMLLKRLPDDGIPFWDFDDPAIPNTVRDASAGAIMASALVEIASQTKNKSLGKKCLEMAVKQLRTLAGSDYLAKEGENGGFLLKHSVGSKPGNSEVDVPLTYADYYFLEALLRYKTYITND
jgi:hypothetical protein